MTTWYPPIIVINQFHSNQMKNGLNSDYSILVLQWDRMDAKKSVTGCVPSDQRLHFGLVEVVDDGLFGYTYLRQLE